MKALGIYSDPTVPGRLDQIVVGGQFAGLNGVRSYNLLRFNPDGTVDLSFANFMLDGPVNAIAMGSGEASMSRATFWGREIRPSITLAASGTLARMGLTSRFTISASVPTPR